MSVIELIPSTLVRDAAPVPSLEIDPAKSARERAASLVSDHYNLVWRLLRRHGVPSEHAEDVAQQVFVVATVRVGDILPGRERAFLVSVAIHLADEHRRSKRRLPSDGQAEDLAAPTPPADVLADQKRAREALDALLDEMDTELRIVFVLFEIEGLTTPEIAASLGIPLGTAASRLRRARDEFQILLRRFEQRATPKRGLP